MPRSTTTTPNSPHVTWSRLDAFGATASFLCALHCLAIPVLVAALPLTGLHVLENHDFDRVFVVLAVLFGGAVIGSGYCVHRWRTVAALYLVSTALLITGAFFLVHPPTHGIVLALGGFTLAAAHLINRRGVHAHRCARSVFSATEAPVSESID
jgi:hypothetical protein